MPSDEPDPGALGVTSPSVILTQVGIQSRKRCHSHAEPALVKTGVGIHHDATMNQYYIYILANQRNGTLYIGMTNNLIRRVWEHKTDAVDGFTKKYGVHRLVWYEIAETPEAAITREKQLKKWNRAWKRRLIEEMNPEWKDLYEEITG
jgi:putative endonuclease